MQFLFNDIKSTELYKFRVAPWTWHAAAAPLRVLLTYTLLVLISLLRSRRTAALAPKGQTQRLLPPGVLTSLLFRADKYWGAKWGKSDFFSSAPLDVSLSELEGLTGAKVNTLICTTKNILPLWQQLLSHSQCGQFIT